MDDPPPAPKWSGWRTADEVDAALKARGITYDEATGRVDWRAFFARIKAAKAAEKGPAAEGTKGDGDGDG